MSVCQAQVQPYVLFNIPTPKQHSNRSNSSHAWKSKFQRPGKNSSGCGSVLVISVLILWTVATYWGSKKAFVSSHRSHSWNLTCTVCRLEQNDAVCLDFAFSVEYLLGSNVLLCVKHQKGPASPSPVDLGKNQLLHGFPTALHFPAEYSVCERHREAVFSPQRTFFPSMCLTAPCL